MPGPRASIRSDVALHRVNQLLSERAFQGGERRVHHKPLSVYLQVASGCNLECYMCIELLRPPDMRRGRGLKSLPREVFEKLCTQVFPYSSNLHIGFGGEPTLSPDFAYFVERAFESGQQVELTTNGTRLLQGGLAEVLARCASFVQVSIDAATRETYERIRVGSRWAHLRANLDALNAARLAYPADERTRLGLVFVLMRSNLHELPAFVEMAAELQADVVRAQHVIPTTEQGRGETLFETPGRYNAIRAEAQRRADALGVRLDAPRDYPLPSAAAAGDVAPVAADAPAEAAEPASAPARGAPIGCRLPTQHLFVSYEGLVMPCCHPHANVKMRAGDLRVEDFDAIWNNAQYRALRGGLHDGDVHPICRTCSIVQDPPPATEDLDGNRAAPTLLEWSAGRAAEDAAAPRDDVLEALLRAGVFAEMEETLRDRRELRKHAAILEAERGHLLGHIGHLKSRSGVRFSLAALARRLGLA